MTRDDGSTPTFTEDSTARASAASMAAAGGATRTGQRGGAARARLRLAFRGRRGSAQLGLLVAATAVAGGLTIGSGVAAHSAKSGYELAWLADGTRGQVVQVDPVLGRTNVRLQVAAPGSDLDIQQSNGQLVIVDRKTGKVSSIDLGTLLVGGSRTEAAGKVKVLLGDERMYVANLGNGTIQAVDPRNEATVGTPWSAGGALVDVGIDGQHRVWALGADQKLTSLQWQPAKATLAPVGERVLTGTGTGSVIVGHPRGVTVIGAQGTVARVGTGHDSTVRSPQVHGPLSAPQSSPSGLVPVSDPGNSSVVIVGNDGTVVDRVDTLGCSTPGAPIAFEDKVYVPCIGAGMVIVLDSNGQQVADPIRTSGGGDPQLTVSGGHLLVSAPGGSSATVVDGSGNTHSFPTVDPSTPVQNPSTPPSSPPPPPPASPTRHHDPKGGSSDHGNGGGDHPAGPGDPSTSSSAGTTPPDQGSGSASATARTDGTVLVMWSGPTVRGGYSVTSGTASVAEVTADATSAIVTVLDPGTTTTLTVHAYDGAHHEKWSATTNPVTVGGQPVTVSNVRYTAGAVHGGVVTLTASWTASTATGQLSYVLSSSATSATVTTATTSAALDVPCSTGCSGTLTVTPSSAASQGTPSQVPFSVTSTPTPTQPASSAPPQPGTTAPAPPTTAAPAPTPTPAPLPAAGQSMLTSTKTIGNETNGVDATVTLSMTSPGDWASWSGGTCAIVEDGVIAPNQAITCAQNGVISPEFDYYESGTHTYLVRATASDGRTSDSASITVSVVVRPGTGCGQVPFANIGGVNTRLPGCEPTCGQYQCWLQPQHAVGADTGLAGSTRREGAVTRPASSRPASSQTGGGGIGGAAALLAATAALAAGGATRRWMW